MLRERSASSMRQGGAGDGVVLERVSARMAPRVHSAQHDDGGSEFSLNAARDVLGRSVWNLEWNTNINTD